jgi:hypothetical protein
MRLVTVVGDEKANPEKLRSRLAGIVDIHFEPLEVATKAEPSPVGCVRYRSQQ